MAVSKLILHFDAQAKLPVPVSEVLSEVRKVVLDERIELHGVDTRETKMRGTHYRYTKPAHPDGALMDEKVVQVIYSTRQSNEWQRLVCCKELIHIFDSMQVRTKQKEEVVQLGRILAGGTPKDWPAKNKTDLHVFFDELAKWQALAIMFPFGFRSEALVKLRANETSMEKIAELVELPVEYVGYVMADRWEPLRERILTSC